MDLHIVGGFLGSGKTMAIIGAAKHMMAYGRRVDVVTNDQGRYLVDTAFFRSEAVPTVEVTGGCFCTPPIECGDRSPLFLDIRLLVFGFAPICYIMVH